MASLRTLPDLLREFGLEQLHEALAQQGVTLASLAAKLKESRPTLLAHLKESGVEKLGDRQKIANAVAKADRLGNLQPYLDEAAAIASGLSAGTSGAGAGGAARLASATELKQRGNEAFKAGANAAAVDAWGDALLAAAEAAKEPRTAAAASGLLAPLHSNTAAALLKLRGARDNEHRRVRQHGSRSHGARPAPRTPHAPCPAPDGSRDRAAPFRLWPLALRFGACCMLGLL